MYNIEIDTLLDTKEKIEFKKNVVRQSRPCSFDYSREEYSYWSKRIAIHHSISYNKFEDIYYVISLYPPNNLNKHGFSRLKTSRIF